MKAAFHMVQYSIRTATHADLEQVYEVEVASFSNPYPTYLIEQLLHEYPESFFVAASGSGLIIGYCVSTKENHSLHLISIAVRPEHRGEGIGGALMLSLLKFAQSCDGDEIVLEVKLDNAAALALYRKFGFADQRVIDNYYSDGARALRMQLVLKESPEDN